MYWAIKALSYHLIKESSVIMRKVNYTTGDGIIVSVCIVAGLIIGYMWGEQSQFFANLDSPVGREVTETFSLKEYSWLVGTLFGGLGGWFVSALFTTKD